MSVVRCGVSCLCLGRLGRGLAVVGLVLMLTGCASQKAAQRTSSGANPSVAARVDAEADGQPAQPPPPISIRTIADDPREPWSPNYGTVVPVKGVGEGSPAPVPVVPRALAPLAPAVDPAPASRPLPVAPASPPSRAAGAETPVPTVEPPTRLSTTPAGIRVELPADFRRKMAEVGVR